MAVKLLRQKLFKQNHDGSKRNFFTVWQPNLNVGLWKKQALSRWLREFCFRVALRWQLMNIYDKKENQ